MTFLWYEFSEGPPTENDDTPSISTLSRDVESCSVAELKESYKQILQWLKELKRIDGGVAAIDSSKILEDEYEEVKLASAKEYQPASIQSAQEIIDEYRNRWNVEIFFKEGRCLGRMQSCISMWMDLSYSLT